MNRQQRRSKEKMYGLKYSPTAPLDLLTVHAMVEPLESFIAQIKRNEMYVDQRGRPVMDLVNLEVERLAEKGLPPAEAVPNIRATVEIYFQVVAYCFTEDDLEKVGDEILEFERLFLNPLRLSSPIMPTGLQKADQLCMNMKAALRKAPGAKVVRVMNEIQKVLNKSERENGKVTIAEMRQWLIDL